MSLPEFTELQTARIAFLVGCGFSPKEIAADSMITVKPESVAFYIDRLGLPPTPRPGVPRSFRVMLPFDFHSALERAAEARGLTRTALAEKILTEVIAGQLIGAVLDDGVS